MSEHFFISYSSVDGKAFALKLADALAAEGVPVWVDKRNLNPSGNRDEQDEQIVEALRGCKGLIFVMTRESVQSRSGCKNEWTRALRYKKPIVPLLVERDAELPLRLGSRDPIDFTGSFDSALKRLRSHLARLDEPAGQLQALKERLADAQQELSRAEPEQEARIREDITELERQVAQQQAFLDNPEAAAQRVQESINSGLERVRQPAKRISRPSQGKVINSPPLVAPTWFQNRHVETQLIGEFLKDDALRLMTVVGRGGVGKSAMVCRLLRSLEGGQLPDDGGPLAVDGIVYLSDSRAFHRVTVPDLYTSLAKLLPDESAKHLEVAYKNYSTRDFMQALLGAFPDGRTVVLLDNFEDELDVESGQFRNSELEEALRALLELPPHGLKVIITTRVAPRGLAMVAPALQRRHDLDEGLESPHAENVLRAMDVDGKLGLRDAPDALLAEARARTRGYPRALEHLVGILSADRDTSLREILDDTRRFLPEQVVEVLVGEAFNRLDLTAQRAMQALAIYRYPVPPASVDYLLQPHVPGVESGLVLKRLVNMQFVRREGERYYLHQVDRDYALTRLPEGTAADRREKDTPPLTRFALQHRAAEWFKLSRQPRESWKSIADLAAQLAEFDLRCEGEDYDAAAALLLELDYHYLQLWGHYRLLAELHERLQGKITDLWLRQRSVGNLGAVYHRMGNVHQGLLCFEHALREARELKDRIGEWRWLGGVGVSYASLGYTEQAIKCHEQALTIIREGRSSSGEAADLSNLGNCYYLLGQISQAIEHYHRALIIDRRARDRSNEALDLAALGTLYAKLGQNAEALQYLKNALTLAQETGYRFIETRTRVFMGYLSLALNQGDEAVQQFKAGIELADDIASAQSQHDARQGLACTHLFQGDLAPAREMVEAARQYDVPLRNHATSALLGLVLLRQGERGEARAAFTTALQQASELLAKSPQFYAALDTQGLARCGLALCENTTHLPTAIEAYRAARAITSDPGIVARELQLFDALALADSAGVLAEVRVVAGGGAALTPTSLRSVAQPGGTLRSLPILGEGEGGGSSSLEEKPSPAPAPQAGAQQLSRQEEEKSVVDSPSHELRELSFKEKQQLVTALLACPTIQDRERRGVLIAQLGAEMASRVPANNVDSVHVLHLVNTCLLYPDGLEELLAVLRFFEGNALPMRRLEALVKSLLHRPSDSTAGIGDE